MRPEDIRELLHTEPFKPFRVHLSDGRTFDIHHPEFVFVLRSRLDIGVADNSGSEFPDRTERCALLHIVSVEELQPA